jgi:hypothetical protein
MPMQQKGVLLVIFGMGGFVIVASILTKVYCLVPSLISYVYMNWYFREASVAVYVTNLPTIWPLLRELFPGLQTWGTRSKVSGTSGERPWVSSDSRARFASKDDLDMKPFRRAPRAESQERINDSDSGRSMDPHTIGIQRDVSFTVQSETVERGSGGASHRGWDKQKVTTVVNTVN